MFPFNMFPFNKELKGSFQGMQSQDIDKYVQDMMSKVFSQMNTVTNLQNTPLANQHEPVQSQKGSQTSPIFETHDFVFAMIPIKEEEWLRRMKVYHTSNQLIIEHVPEENDRKVYTLPSTVKKKGASATYKDGVLEVKIPKNIDLQYSEIQVSELL